MADEIIFSDSEGVSTEKLNDLFKAIGWKRDPSKWQKIFEKSTYIVTAYNQGVLVGFGRIMEDGVMCMFYDICVHPDYQKKGIGTKIMQMLIDKVKDKGYVSIGLFTWEENPENVAFYESFGFEKVKTGMELFKHMVRE